MSAAVACVDYFAADVLMAISSGAVVHRGRPGPEGAGPATGLDVRAPRREAAPPGPPGPQPPPPRATPGPGPGAAAAPHLLAASILADLRGGPAAAPGVASSTSSSSAASSPSSGRAPGAAPAASKSHRCPFPGCAKAYYKSSHLKSHLRTHTGSHAPNALLAVSAPLPVTGQAVTRSSHAPTSWPATTGRTRGRSAFPVHSAPSASPAVTTSPSTRAATQASARNCSGVRALAAPRPATHCPAAWLAARHPAQHPAQPLLACRACPAHPELTPPRTPATCLLSRPPSSVPLRALRCL